MLDISQDFLYPYQWDAVGKMKNGCILNGGVGSGKSRVGLYYYFSQNGGSQQDTYVAMRDTYEPLYIITTAMKRDRLEWEPELNNYLLSSYAGIGLYDRPVVVDSWNNIKKYKDVRNSFFIFDEDRVTGNGMWVKVFIRIAKNNHWILLSATPGDKWEDYIPVFIANGFYKNITEFRNEHVIYDARAKYPKVLRYLNQGQLIKYKNDILIDMDDQRKTTRHKEVMHAEYDRGLYKKILSNRWNYDEDKPIENISGLCSQLRKVANSDKSRADIVLEIKKKHARIIVFYNFDYELDILKSLDYGGATVREWNGHKHDSIPDSEEWVYLVQYNAGSEGWNCIKTNALVFYSQSYSYRMMTQAAGRIDRIDTPFQDLYYYHITSYAPLDIAINRALLQKKDFNENRYYKNLTF